MENPKVFVSYAAKDGGFVSLLVKLLRFHEIDAWYSGSGLQGGDVFQGEIEAALAKADALVVIVSTAAAASKWVQSEILMFEAGRRGRRIVPLILDDTKPSEVFESLSSRQHVDFSVSLSSGFDDLLRTFDREFLVAAGGTRERRTIERRATARGIESGDRRKSDLRARMRRGFWLSFYRETELEKHDPFRLNLHNLDRVIRGLLKEAERYGYRHRITGALAAPKPALVAAATAVWERMRDWDHLSTVNVVEAIAEQIYADNEVTMRTRRETDRRDKVAKRVGV